MKIFKGIEIKVKGSEVDESKYNYSFSKNDVMMPWGVYFNLTSTRSISKA